MSFVINKPEYVVLIDDQEISHDIEKVQINHDANAIDSFAAVVSNQYNQYDTFFTDKLREIEVWVGENRTFEKIFRGFVETPIPEIVDGNEILSLSGLGNALFLDMQEVPESHGTYTSKTIAYIVDDIFSTYVEGLQSLMITSGSTTYNVDPTNKKPLSLFQELAIIGKCYLYTDPFDNFLFAQKSDMPKLHIEFNEEVCTRIKHIPDFSNIINFYTFKGSGSVKVTSQDTLSQSRYWKRYDSDEDKNFGNNTLAQAYADEIIETYKNPLWRYELDVPPMMGLKVNHKAQLNSDNYDVSDEFIVQSIRRDISPEGYSISVSLENKPPSKASIFGDYEVKLRKLLKDVQL